MGSHYKTREKMIKFVTITLSNHDGKRMRDNYLLSSPLSAKHKFVFRLLDAHNNNN